MPTKTFADCWFFCVTVIHVRCEKVGGAWKQKAVTRCVTALFSRFLKASPPWSFVRRWRRSADRGRASCDHGLAAQSCIVLNVEDHQSRPTGDSSDAIRIMGSRSHSQSCRCTLSDFLPFVLSTHSSPSHISYYSDHNEYFVQLSRPFTSWFHLNPDLVSFKSLTPMLCQTVFLFDCF